MLKIRNFLISFFGLIVVSGSPLPAQEEAPKASFSAVVIEAFSQENAKNYSKAYELYSQALTIRDDSPTVWIRRAHTSAMLGKAEEVGDDLKIGMTKAPITVTDYLTLAWFRGTAPFQSLRDGTLAVTFAQKALRENESIEAYDALAAGYAQMGNFSQARKMAMQGMKRFPASSRLAAMQERVNLYNEKKVFTEVWGDGSDTKMDRKVQDVLKKE
jgi:tetratricopeptide (TPR) repeat protein